MWSSKLHECLQISDKEKPIVCCDYLETIYPDDCSDLFYDKIKSIIMRRIIDRYENAIVKMQNSAKEFTVQGSLIEVNKEIQNGIRILERFTNPDDELINSLSSEAKAIVELCSNKELYHGSTIDISEINNIIDEEQLYELIANEYIIPKLNPIDELKIAILDSGGFLGFIEHISQDDLIHCLGKIDEEFSRTEIVNNPEWDELYQLIKFIIENNNRLKRITKFEKNILLGYEK